MSRVFFATAVFAAFLMAKVLATEPMPPLSNTAFDSKSSDLPPKQLRFEPSWRKPFDCGPLSLYVLMRLLGKDVSVEDVLNTIPIDPSTGCTALELSEKSKELGFSVAARFVNPDVLRSLNGPFVIHHNGSLVSGVGHYLVVLGYFPEKQAFRTLNTDGGFLTWTSEAIVTNNFSGYVLIPEESLENRSMRLLGYELIGVGGLIAIGLCWRYTIMRRQMFKL